ncbi:MAG TPA: gamma-glutamyl-gamma-aminobutyrate hydrolase family protein [Bryobacteraceae bacterium]|jgi:putative glutamine amidotransferase
MKRAVLTIGNLKKMDPYRDALTAAGVDVLVATVEQPIESLQGMGLVLCGGSDVDPALYGAARDPQCEASDAARDELEQKLLREALSADLPVLAICRGMQLFNVTHAGGTLVQHLEGHRISNHGTHDVEVFEGTRLAGILGAGVHAVNSRHHQAVERMGAGLTVSAKSPTGVIDGLERADLRFAVAVQWHPEDMVERVAVQRRLFEAFANEL